MHLISLPGSRLDTARGPRSPWPGGAAAHGTSAGAPARAGPTRPRLPGPHRPAVSESSRHQMTARAEEGLLVQAGGDAGARSAAGARPGAAGASLGPRDEPGNGGRRKCYSLVTCGSAASPVHYDGGRSTSASGRSSAATWSAYPGSQVASSSARMRSSSGRSRRRAAAGRRREARRRQERRREDCCCEGNSRGVTGPDHRTPRRRRRASETISTATTATAITSGIIHSPPVPVQLGYARLNDATPGTQGKWFMTESAELFGAIRPIAEARPPLTSGPSAATPLSGRHRVSRSRVGTEGPSLVQPMVYMSNRPPSLNRFRCHPI